MIDVKAISGSLRHSVFAVIPKGQPQRRRDAKKTQSMFQLFFLFLFVFISPQLKADEDTEFQLALRLYENLQYAEALPKFENLVKQEFHSRTTASYVFYGKTLLHLGKPVEAENNLEKFLELYPESNYSDEARLTLAKAYFDQKNYSNAFYELLFLADKGKTRFYPEHSKTVAGNIAVNNLSSEQLTDILAHTSLENQKPFIQLLLGKVLLKENKREEAKQTFIGILQQYPASAEKAEADQLYKKTLEPGNDVGAGSANSLIGVILPLTKNSNSAAAEEILEGIKFAVSEFNSQRDDKIGLVIKDSELNNEKISVIKKEINEISEIKAVLGPVFSSEVRSALKEFKGEKIPIISPTATEDDLTLMYENFFQANPNFSTRGRLMAQYIYFVENKRSIAVLNALDGYSPLLASSFIGEFERLGGQVVVKETYKSGSYNLTSPVAKIQGQAALIEGIYIPLANKLDAPAILSQLVQSGIDVSIYGDQDWLNAKGFETSPSLSNKITFTSDYFIDYNDPDFQQFSKDFLRKTNMDVNRNVLYGYDTAKYLLTVLRNFSGGKDAVKQKIESGLTTNGFHNNISFDENRINRFLNIIRYSDGIFQLVDEFKVNN
ncbi:MAG: ABC transporter substrate-binding protein [Ignavibacteriaceae bacterium]